MNNKESKIFCSVCGEIIELEFKFCPSCGAAIQYKNEGKSSSSKNEFISKESEKSNKISGYKKSENAKQEKKSESQISQVKILSPVNLFYILFFLAFTGFVIIYTSGIFDKPIHSTLANNQTQDNFHGGVDLQRLQEINSLEEELKSNPNDKTKLLTLAHLLNDSGFKEKAIERYKQYLKIDSQNADVMVDMGVCYFELDNNNEAIRWMKEALKYQPKHQIAHLNLGIVSITNGKRDEAIEWWKKAVEINPNNEIGKRAQELINSH